MVSGDNKASKASSSPSGRIRTLSDLNRHSAESDSNSGGPQGGEKSGMLVQDPSKRNIVDAIFNQATQQGAIERPFDQSQQPLEAVVPYIVFWSNGFTVNDGPLRSLDDPENATFLESIKKSECPKELEPADGRSSVKVNFIRRSEKYPETEKRSVPTSSAGLVVDQSLPLISIQLWLADGTRLVSQFNNHHTIHDIRAFIDASVPGNRRNYRLQMRDFPPKLLCDETQTIEQAGLANSVVIQKF